MQAQLGRGTVLISHAATLGGRVSRNDLNCLLAGDGADATLNGLVILDGDSHCDNHTLLEHAAPSCPSHELYKHVLSGKSSAVNSRHCGVVSILTSARPRIRRNVSMPSAELVCRT